MNTMRNEAFTQCHLVDIIFGHRYDSSFAQNMINEIILWSRTDTIENFLPLDEPVIVLVQTKTFRDGFDELKHFYKSDSSPYRALWGTWNRTLQVFSKICWAVRFFMRSIVIAVSLLTRFLECNHSSTCSKDFQRCLLRMVKIYIVHDCNSFC